MVDPRVVEALMDVNHLMRQPVTEEECERVLHALYLSNYEVRPKRTERAIRRARRAARPDQDPSGSDESERRG